ncbi:hypothetical protein CH330_00755 [candidate division WOR-3 bacterium JGI_Cruoil_03_51_56]|uniref:N-acetyltransferase domain-containing protein n=1 Tax=candidate division WOR-3 bacterium JGI_Cruoil_03_51_56 TaxID=1973747 RepID=A0A235BXS7_UNCW3|nr:MAG: hypothetical protein CH330_00755 [candidate division WOR-3 bacterium JGI_Cruoil_03_51_56]
MDKEIPVLDAFFSEYLGCDISNIVPGHTCITTSPTQEQNAFALWMLITQSRCIVSARGRLFKTVSRLAHTLGIERTRDPIAVKKFVIAAAKSLGIKKGVSSTSGPVLYCTPETLRIARLHPCRSVNRFNIAAVKATGLCSPWLDKSISEGTCFAAWDEDKPVSLAGTCMVPHMADEVAEMSVPGTLAPYRGKGFGRTAVSHATEAVLKQNKVPVYITSDRNVASIATARSVGYRQYGWQYRVQLPARKQ